MPDLTAFLPRNPFDFLEVGAIAVVVYLMLKLVRGTIAASILRGAVLAAGVVLVGTALAIRVFDLQVLSRMLSLLTSVFMITLVIVFQPELRRGLLSLGEHRWLYRWKQDRRAWREGELVRSVQMLVKERHGALFCIERRNALTHIARTGVPVDAEARAELLASVFWAGSPLHDGGLVIRGDRIVAAACILPVTQRHDLAATMGTRHRAALGLSEETDALIVVVSEETGNVTLAMDGKLIPVDPPAALPELLARHLAEVSYQAPPHSNPLTSETQLEIEPGGDIARTSEFPPVVDTDPKGSGESDDPEERAA